jgi:hypothetical protein
LDFISEETNSQLAKHYTSALNVRFALEGIPVRITTHFVDRINDPRNQESISLKEIVDFFSKLLLKRKKFLQELDDGVGIQVIDLETDIHVPFIKSQGVLVATTIMRGEMRRGPQRKVAI